MVTGNIVHGAQVFPPHLSVLTADQAGSNLPRFIYLASFSNTLIINNKVHNEELCLCEQKNRANQTHYIKCCIKDISKCSE